MEEGEGGGAARQGRDPSPESWPFPGLTQHRPAIHTSLGHSRSRTDVLWGNTRPRRAPASPGGLGRPPCLCPLLPQVRCGHAGGMRTAPAGVCAPVGGLSNRPAVQPAWWVQGRWIVGLCPLTSTRANTEAETAKLCRVLANSPLL